MEEHLIEIKNLTKKFSSPSGNHSDVYALKNINLTIPKRSIYGIIGMSGAGKSTLLRCLTGLDIPTEGTIYFNGEVFPYTRRAAESVRKQMGMVFQHFQLFSSRTVSKNICYPLEIAGISKKERLERMNELLSLVGLEKKKTHYPSQLSGGEKQRIGIARALASNPSLLLCDEPTSALDPKTTRDILQLLNQLNQQLGLTIVMITHQLEVVKQVCQRVAVLDHGEIVEEGLVRDIFTQPKHPTTRHLLHLDNEQVPQDILNHQYPNKCLIRLGFEGQQAKQPLLSQMIKRFEIHANILSGGLDQLQDTVVGHLFVELEGTPQEIERALSFLRNQHVICEVIT